MGIFMSEFLIVTSTMAKSPWLAIALVAGLLIGLLVVHVLSWALY